VSRGYHHVRDFRITKTKQGSWANYSTSGLSYKERPLSASEREAIAQHGLLNLGEFIGPEPEQEPLDLTWQLYEDRRAGRAFDAARYPGFRAFESKFSDDVLAANGHGERVPPLHRAAQRPTEVLRADDAEIGQDVDRGAGRDGATEDGGLNMDDDDDDYDIETELAEVRWLRAKINKALPGSFLCVALVALSGVVLGAVLVSPDPKEVCDTLCGELAESVTGFLTDLKAALAVR